MSEPYHWRPMKDAPKDRYVVLNVAGYDDLPPFITIAKYDAHGGWCVDELRETTGWMEIHTLDQFLIGMFPL